MAKKTPGNQYQEIADLSNEGIIIHTDGIIREGNLAACKILGFKQKELIGLNAVELVLNPRLAAMQSNIEKRRKTQEEIQLQRKDGQLIWLKLRAKTIDYRGEELRVILFRDITSRKEAEQIAKKSEERYKRLSEASFEGILIHQDGQIVDSNQVCSDLFGYTKEELMTMQAYELGAEDDRNFLRDQVLKGVQDPYEARGQRKDGTIFFCELHAKEFYYDNDRKARVVAIRDISRRKDFETVMRQANADYETLISQSPDGLFIINENGIILFANPSAYQILGVKQFKDIQNRPILDFVLPQYHIAVRERHDLLNDGYDIPFMKMDAKRLDGSIVEVEYKPVSIDYRGKKAILVVYHDIEYQEQLAREKMRFQIAEETNKALKQSLAEKEVLLKEVHHRVKNNLQVISSILNLQSSYTDDPRTIELLKESQNRIKSMSFIHESLYQTKNFAGVNFKEYVHNLCNNLLFSYYPKGKRVFIEQEIADVHLNLDTSIPCGLIINELISNSLKYAFVNQEEGTIHIVVKGGTKKEKDLVTITVNDNGPGLPKGLDFEDSPSLGLQLVTVLTKQLNGKITLDNSKGAKYTLTFVNENGKSTHISR